MPDTGAGRQLFVLRRVPPASHTTQFTANRNLKQIIINVGIIDSAYILIQYILIFICNGHIQDMQNIENLSIPELLKAHAKILKELKERKATRTINNPTGDYAEYLFSKAFGWKLLKNSAASADALDQETNHSYQIKARRLTGGAGDRQLGIMRNLDQLPFNSLAAVLFDENYLVHRAVIMPVQTVRELSTYIKHVNGYRLILNDKVMMHPEVKDVTTQMRYAETTMVEETQSVLA